MCPLCTHLSQIVVQASTSTELRGFIVSLLKKGHIITTHQLEDDRPVWLICRCLPIVFPSLLRPDSTDRIIRVLQVLCHPFTAQPICHLSFPGIVSWPESMKFCLLLVSGVVKRAPVYIASTLPTIIFDLRPIHCPEFSIGIWVAEPPCGRAAPSGPDIAYGRNADAIVPTAIYTQLQVWDLVALYVEWALSNCVTFLCSARLLASSRDSYHIISHGSGLREPQTQLVTVTVELVRFLNVDDRSTCTATTLSFVDAWVNFSISAFWAPGQKLHCQQQIVKTKHSRSTFILQFLGRVLNSGSIIIERLF